MKHIFITGGVVSGLGKGITAASIGRLLKLCGKKVTLQKLDPYLNIDPGKMSPYQHGEVFVTDDGSCCDLDVGHYERFTDENMTALSNITAGKIYYSVINKERNGDYGGKTVQIIPHITNEIKSHIHAVSENSMCDVLITEIGGTVGDIESLPFLEACRQVQNEVGRENCIFVHVTLMPYIAGSNELKSKPTQHSVKDLLSLGIQPDVLVCRSEIDIPDDVKEKLSLFCNVDKDCVIPGLTCKSIYQAPLMFEKEGLCRAVCRKLGFALEPNLTEWKALVEQINSVKETLKIAIVGKYVEMRDAYLSVAEAMSHAGFANSVATQIEWIQSEDITCENIDTLLAGVDGIVVPSGFGERGIAGKIHAIRYAREHDFPFFGIGLGMQLALIEYARNVIGIADANSTEFDENCAFPIVHTPSEWTEGTDKLPMRLGLHPTQIISGTKLHTAYAENLIYERHRHKFEVNSKFLPILTEGGITISGFSPNESTCEAIEIPSLRWFVGVAFHPEFKSRPNKVHPLFRDFISACKKVIDKTEKI